MKRLPIVLLVAISVLAACGSDSKQDVVFEGQVFWGPSKTEGVDRAFVYIVDASSTRRCVVTACDGTFKVRRADAPALQSPIRVGIVRATEPEALAPEPFVVRHIVSSTIGGEPDLILYDSEAEARTSRLAPTGSCAPGAAPARVECPAGQ